MTKYHLYTVVIGCVIAYLLSPAYARTAENIVGSVTVGEAGYEVPIQVVNNNEEPISGVSARIQSTPRGFKNIKVTPETVSSIPPGETFVFIVSFDVADDAEPSDMAEMVLSVQATDAVFDDASPRVAVKIVKREEEQEEDAIPVLKLVRITGPTPERATASRGTVYEYKENQSGYTAKLVSAGKTFSIMGVAVTHAPLEISPGKPFHIEVEARQKVFLENPPDCDRERSRPEKPSPYWIARGYAGAGKFAPGVSIKASPFRGWARSKDPLGCGNGTVKLTLKLTPEKHEYNDVYQRWISNYTWRVESNDRDAHGTNGMGRGETGNKPRRYFRYPAGDAKIKRDIEVKPHKRSTFLFPLTLQYRTLKPGQTAMESLPPYQFPPELSQPSPDTSGDTETAGGEDRGPGGPGGTGPGTGPGKVSGGPVNPAGLDPGREDVSAKIREWISVAEPPENATEGARFRYDRWGRKIGTTADGATITATSKPDYALSTPEETVWSMRTRLDSVNHCTLEEYVVAKLENRTLENCRGKYRASPAVTVTRLTGLPLAEAKKKLKKAGLKPKLVAGRPAPTKGHEGTIASQAPGPNAKLKKGASVKLEVYGPYVSKTLTLPRVAGLSVKEAKARLKARGLKTRLVAAGPAPSSGQAFKVKETQPGAGTKVKPGTDITLKVYSKYSAPLARVPKVEGLTYPQAKDTLARAGLKASPKSAGPAPSRGKSSRIKSQHPTAGARVKPGSPVKVHVYSKYIPRTAGGGPSEGEGAQTGAWRIVSKKGPTVTSQPGCRRPDFWGNTVHYRTEPDYGNWDFSFTWQSPPAVFEPNKTYTLRVSSNAKRQGRPTGEAGVGARIGVGVKGIRGSILKCYANGREANPDAFAWSTFKETANGEVRITLGPKDPDQFTLSLWITDGGCSAALIGEYTYRRAAGTPRTVVVPRVAGLSYAEAKKRLVGAGLKVSPKSAGPAPSSRKSSRVKDQKPKAGTKAKPGSKVYVSVFSKHVPPPTGQVRQDDDCPCVDERGRRYRVAFGMDCNQEYSFRDYNCSGGRGNGNVRRRTWPCDLVGRWKHNSDIVEFTKSGSDYVGRIIQTGSTFGYRPGDTIYKVRKINQGRYEGIWFNRDARGGGKWKSFYIIKEEKNPMMLPCTQMRFHIAPEYNISILFNRLPN